MIGFDLDEIQELGERLPVGGYVCKILSVEDDEEKQCLKIEYDVAEGNYKGYYANREWKPAFFRSYKAAALPFFKGFIKVIENSNKGFIYEERLDSVGEEKYFDEQCLKGKLFGAVIAEEEYKANDGKVKTRTYVEKVRSTSKIRSGEYEVPELKKLTGQASKKADTVKDLETYYGDDDGELPF